MVPAVLLRPRITGDTMSIMNASLPADLPIWENPNRLGGVPCFRNTRVPIDALFANLEDGVSLDEFVDAFEGVSREDAVAVLEYARGQLQQRAA
jgi:uncharacterized protein (DUF433 family)